MKKHIALLFLSLGFFTACDMVSGEGEGASELGTSQIPVADSPIFTSVKIGKGKTHTYVVKVWYDKSNKNTNEDNSKFTGDVKVVYEDKK